MHLAVPLFDAKSSPRKAHLVRTLCFAGFPMLLAVLAVAAVAFGVWLWRTLDLGVLYQLRKQHRNISHFCAFIATILPVLTRSCLSDGETMRGWTSLHDTDADSWSSEHKRFHEYGWINW
jgi:hypothetical protein